MPTAKKSPAKKPAKPAAKKPARAAKVATPVPKKPAKAASAKPSKSGTSTLADRLANVAIPADAWALARVQPGVGITPHIDKLLALGFPNMICVVDEPLPSTDAKKALRTYDISRVVPRDMLARLFAYKSTYDPSQRDAAFAADPTPFELASVVGDEIAASSWDRIWLLEAIFGSEPVAEAFVDALVKAPEEEWTENVVGRAPVIGLGAVLDRTPAATRERLRGALEKLYGGLGDHAYTDGGTAIDIILHGREGVERSAYDKLNKKFDSSDYQWARDDPRWIETQLLADIPRWKPRERRWFDAQLAFIGGPKVLASLRKVLASGVVMPDHKDAVSDQLALFA